MKTGFNLLAAFSFLYIGISAVAQPATRPTSDEAAMKKQFYSTVKSQSAPTEAHKLLEALVGDFDQRSEVRFAMAVPIHMHSIGQGKWTMDGRFVEVRSASAPDEDVKGERLSIYGYDPTAKKYTLWGIETMSLTSFSATGDYDADKKTFTFEGDRVQPGAGPVHFKWVLNVNDDKSLKQQILMKFPGAENYMPVVTVIHTPIAK